MKITKIFSKIAILFASLFMWISGLLTIVDVTKGVSELNDLVKLMSSTKTQPPLSLGDVYQDGSYTIQEKNFVIELSTTYTILDIFLILLFAVAIGLIVVCLVSLFVEPLRGLPDYWGLFIVVPFLLLSIIYMSNCIILNNFVEKAALISGISDLSIVMTVLSGTFNLVLENVIFVLFLIFGLILLFNMFSVKDQDNFTVKKYTSDVNSKTSNIDSVESSYQNAIRTKIAEADMKLKTIELEKEFEEKMKKLKNIEDNYK